MTKARINTIRAQEILDSRGRPTIEVTVRLSDGSLGVAAVPSGASTGQFEALELRDGDMTRYQGRGVLHACKNVEEQIFPKLRGMRCSEQEAIDARMKELDGTPNKSRCGANALLGVSLACARAGAASNGEPLYRYLRSIFELALDGFRLPEPMLNILNGGRHADNGLDFQEYMIVPHGATFEERLRRGSDIASSLGNLIHARGLPTLVGDEGGYAPHLSSNTEPLELLMEAIHATKLKAGEEVHLALDVAASEFFSADDQQYMLKQDQRRLHADDMIQLYSELAERFPLCSIEDGLADVDEAGWMRLTKRMKDSLLLVGDDLFVTNPQRLEAGVAKGIANAIIIKPNQIGTLSETIETIRMANASAYTPIVSHRSGETTDAFIADLAVAVNAPYLKAGSLMRGERLVKYNRLLAIEAELV